MSKVALPEPFVLIQNNPWGGHSEVIRSARGQDGVIDCYIIDQMEAYAAAKVSEALGWQPIETAPKDGTWVRLWREPDSLFIASPEIIAVWREFGGNEEAVWVWPTEMYDPYTESGRDRAMAEIEAGDFYEDDSFTHWMPLPTPPSTPA